jgi:beta-glucosidase
VFGQNFWYLKGVERLGIPSIMVTDGPHGLRKQAAAPEQLGLSESVPASCFPTASALARSRPGGRIKKRARLGPAEALLYSYHWPHQGPW